MQDVYRCCASAVVLRSSGDGYEVLLLHKPRKKDAWQLPQGGKDGDESLEETALRELKEEAGISAHVIGKSKEVYQYDFPSSYRRFRPDNVCGQRLEFVLAVAEPNADVIVDQDEIDAFVWVVPQELPSYLKRREYLDVAKKLVEEGANLINSEG